MSSRFKGAVKTLSALSEKAKIIPVIQEHIDNFKDYWLYGFNIYVGKDIATSRPNPPEGHRHVHLHPGIFEINCKSWSESEKCWDKWAGVHFETGDDAQDIATNQHPTSDKFLCYLVDDERNAYIFHYQIENGHAFLNSQEYIELVNKVSNQIENGGKCIMGWDSHNDLFKPKWLKK